ncbi:MAG: fibronectin type III domain-containing protein [Bacteroidales bacterium]|nr:fibronectin type III domain-containing protein [Bacteroidales bacterium]
MKKLHFLFVLISLFGVVNTTNAIVPSRGGWWKFDDSVNLTKAEAGFGNDLILVGTQSATAGVSSGDGAVLIGKGSYYKMQHAISPNGGGTKVNEYTLQFDFKVSATNVWHTFFQTTETNDDDGDFFVNTSGKLGVAAVTYSNFVISPNEWYRLVISVKNGSFFNCYLDGKILLTGNLQTVDGRFALSNLLLIFADNDGEDENIYCSELAIWNQALDAAQISELGGFGRYGGVNPYARVPYLQGQTTNSINICWHDTAQTSTNVEYGITANALNNSTSGSSEVISDPYRWHTVKLTGLQADTHYYYRVGSGGVFSPIYGFRTKPTDNFKGKLRFILLSDTHNSDSTMSPKVLRAARAKITQLYGTDIENQLTGIFHSGDVVVTGSVPSQYSDLYFKPLSYLSANVPTMVVAGNHEGESPYFYQYLKLDDQSAFPQDPNLNEKFWSQRIANSLFIGLNSNISTQYGNTESAWLDAKLAEAESDGTIDFVFLFFHHLPFSELWNVTENGTRFTKGLFPIIQKYTKVQQMHYGHTHGFERGTILSDKKDADFRIICGGGGGGAVDPWNSNLNHDYNDIHICINHNFYQILDIDVANHSYQDAVYSIGNSKDPRNNERIDFWYKNNMQSGPETPVIENTQNLAEYIQFNASKFIGVDSLMTAQYQVTEELISNNMILDSMLHWKNIFGIDAKSKPVDKNLNLVLMQMKVAKSLLTDGKNYVLRVRYRDHNLKWSDWSAPVSFKADGTINGVKSINDDENGYQLHQNFPNPFQNSTSIAYSIPETTQVSIRVYNECGSLVKEVQQGVMSKGIHQINMNAANMKSGFYFYQLATPKYTFIKKMIVL